MSASVYRMVPTRAKPSGGWFRAWTFEGTEDGAIATAREFFEREQVPVLVRGLDHNGLLTCSIGVFSHRKLRADRGKRR